jgi:hypothetical protein
MKTSQPALVALAASICCSAIPALAQEQAPRRNQELQTVNSSEKVRVNALAMINALANRNSSPKLVGRHHTPVFGKKYDWSEYTRVWGKAIPEIVDHVGDAWSELVKHIDDERYCITLGNDSGSFNWTVGVVCRRIVASNLTEACYQAVKTESKGDYARLCPEVVLDNTKLKSWCVNRVDKRLYQMQIEMCGLAIAQVSKADEDSPSPQTRRAWGAALEAEIRSLRESKRAVRFNGFGSEEFDLYSAEKAEKLREELNSDGNQSK